MNRVKFLTILAISLMLVNLLLVSWMLFHKGPHPDIKGKNRNLIIEKLDLDTEQIKEYDQLILWHRSHIESLEDSIKSNKNLLYQSIYSDNKTIKDSLINKLGDMQKAIENVHYQHFEDIKKLCKPEQLSKFIVLMNEVERIFSNHPKDIKPKK